MTSHYKIYFISLLASVMLAACGAGARRDNDRPVLAVSIEPLRNIVEAIAGDDYDVTTVLQRGANPENFDPSTASRIDIDNSVAFFTVGAFSFEDVLAKSINDRDKIVDTSAGIKRIYGTHSHHDHSGHAHHHHNNLDADPHVWTSAANTKIIARNIADRLAELNPDQSDKYHARLDSLYAIIDGLDGTIRQQLADSGVKSFAIWHPSLSYFARDYDLTQIAVGQESKELSARQLREVVDRLSADSIGVFFMQREFDPRQAQTVIKRTNVRLSVIDPLDYDWQKQLKLIADELSR